MTEKIIELIISDIKTQFKNEHNLDSLSLVGSFANPNKKLEDSNDLDFVIIFDKLTSKNLMNLKSFAKKIRDKYSSKEIDINYTFKIGPIKISSKKSKSILIHFLVYSKYSFLNYESKTVRYSFQFYPTIIGKSINEINGFPEGVNIDLFNDIDGIPARRSWITSGKIKYIETVPSGVKITETRLKKDTYLEVVFYSILWLANDMLRLRKEYYQDIDLEMCKSFKKRFSMVSRGIPLKFYSYKHALRKKGLFTGAEINKIKEEALVFLNECEFYLRDKI